MYCPAHVADVSKGAMGHDLTCANDRYLAANVELRYQPATQSLEALKLVRIGKLNEPASARTEPLSNGNLDKDKGAINKAVTERGQKIP